MIQIDTQPVPPSLPERPSTGPDQRIGRLAGQAHAPTGDLAVAEDGIVFVSPPSLPFPRVFPGL